MPQAITLSSVNGRRFLAIFGAAFIAIAALFTIDTFLAHVDKSESNAEAARLFNEARQFMAGGKNVQAVDRLKDALAIERENKEYEETLATALLAAGKPADAQSVLADLLETYPMDGQSNLTMARVLAQQGKIDDAISYYHRAIYGRWGDAAAANRLSVRYELIDLLAHQGRKEELLAELLPVEEQASNDTPTRLRLGRLFLEAGSYARAAGIFQAILDDQPKNADARTGLGEAEFGRGNYPSAENEFAAALRINPADSEARTKFEVCRQILALDPTRRGLSATERYQRSRTILDLTVNEIAKCPASWTSSNIRELLEKARSGLDRRVRASDQSDASDSFIDLAEQLWLAKEKSCRTTPGNDPLSLVLNRLAQ